MDASFITRILYKNIYWFYHKHTDYSLTDFNFWHSGALALSPERQSARMSKIKNGRLDQYGKV